MLMAVPRMNSAPLSCLSHFPLLTLIAEVVH
jgi:hypothetical protein